MKLGIDIAVITPSGATTMGGYGARTGMSAGVHDPLTVRTLVLEESGHKRALLVADLIGFPRSQVRRVQLRAAALSGLAPEDILVAATHTHSGPLNFDAPGFGGKADRAYIAWLEDTLARSVARAAEAPVPVRVGWGRMPVYGVGSIRRAADETGVREAGNVTTIGFAAMDGRLMAVLLHYACHPTVLGPENLLFSADLLGSARAHLERSLGGVPVLTVNGACGDVSTRFTRREQSFAEMERMGDVVARAARGALSGIVYREVVPGDFSSAAVDVPLPQRPLPAPEQAERELKRARDHWEAVEEEARLGKADHGAVRLAKTALEGATVQALLAQSGGRHPLETEAQVTAWRFDSCGLVTVPGELFFSLGEAIAAQSGVDCCLVLGYTGGFVGYIPDEAAYATGGYEVLSTHLDRQAGPALVTACAALLRALGHREA